MNELFHIGIQNMKTVVCTKCNWTSFAVTREKAEREVAKFNDYFEALSQEDQQMFAGPASVESYVCEFCGGRKFKPGNSASKGSTINPVIYAAEKEK